MSCVQHHLPSGECHAQRQGIRGPPAPPAVSLPKGGGAIRGIGEKFTANPATGTLGVPIPVSPDREFRGFGMVEQWDTEEFAAFAAASAAFKLCSAGSSSACNWM